MEDDRDLFGDLLVPAADPPAYMVEKPRATQVRLFEPQMEGQITLGERRRRIGDLTVRALTTVHLACTVVTFHSNQ